VPDAVDGNVVVPFRATDTLTLGNIPAGRSRSAVFTFRATASGPADVVVSALSENAWAPAVVAPVDVIECVSAAECDDGLFCNGVEICSAGICADGPPVSCDAGSVCSERFDFCAVDSDGDGAADYGDNCLDVWNKHQTDSDEDGFGNACDADYDQNGVVGISDFNRIQRVFGTSIGHPDFEEVVDCNADAVIGVPDFECFKRQFGGPPGPSGLTCMPDDVCTAGDVPAATCIDWCVVRVCGDDPYCCDVAWDSICVNAAELECGRCQ
jgi:hypothetical protein